MTTRTAYLDFRERGAAAATGNVRTLADALARQRREAVALAPALRAAQQGTGFFGAVQQSAAAKITATTNTLGPLGAGLGSIARGGPLAAQGLLQVVAAGERMTLLSRASNAAILAGASGMIAGGVAAVAYADDILRGADAYAALNARIRIFSDGAVETAQSERALYEMGRETRQGVEALTTLYTRLTPAVQDAGRAQADALQITEMSAKALLIQGANVREAEAATVQFAQALSSGVLRGDELRSLLESSPQLLRYIAQTIEINGKVGVAFGQLRKLGEEGALTTDRVVSALLAAAPAIERDFVNAPKKAAQGWTILKDTASRTIGQIAAATGAQASVVDWLDGLADRLDAFRAEALLNPDSFNQAEAAVGLVGDALETAGALAGGVVENFDLILAAGQAMVALKAGEIMATGFAAAASKARDLYAQVQAFRGNGRFIAGAAMDDVGARAALQARAAADAAAARAADRTADADLKARAASAARAAADAQGAVVTELKASAGVNAVRVTEAETLATTLATQADRAEAQAKASVTAATNAASAASARHAIAQEAEAMVTRQVTGSMALNAAAGRAMGAVYNMLGGALGIYSLALGAVIFSVWRAQQAWEAKIDAMRDAAVVSDELRAISDALAAATWAEVPALLEAARAHREKADAAVEDAKATRDAAKARREGADAAAWSGSPYPGLYGGQAAVAGVQERDAQGVVTAAERDAFRAREAEHVARERALEVEGRARAEENRTGRDAAGRPISEARRSENDRWIASTLAGAADRLASLDTRVERQESAVSRNPTRPDFANGLTVLRESWEATASLHAALTGGSTTSRPTASGDDKLSPEERQILNTLEKVADAALVREMLGRDPADAGKFRMGGEGGLELDGAPWIARSDDEARAGVEYRNSLLDIARASDELIAKTGMTREALMQQAEDTFAAALATSTATQAEQRWADKLAEASGQSLAQARAEREVAEARSQGVEITEEAAAAYVALAVAKDQARRAEEALGVARPVVQEVTREVLDDLGPMPERWDDRQGAFTFDFEAAMRQWSQAREQILAESEARIREAMEAEVAAGTKTREDADRAVAAAKVALEVESAQQVADLWRLQRQTDEDAWRRQLDERLQQERDLADSITGALKDVGLGGDGREVGKRFMDDLLNAAWEELVTNPLNLAIRNYLRSMATGQGGGGGGGLWGSITGFLGSTVSGWFGGSGGGAAPTGGAGAVFGPFKDGGLPGVRLAPGLISGPGGPRDDRILARVSNREFISNAAATRDNLGLLSALNAGWTLADWLKATAPAFGGGGLPAEHWTTTMVRRHLDDLAVSSPLSSPRDPMVLMPAPAAGPTTLQVSVVNNTDTPVEATARRNPDGSIDLILDPMVRQSVTRMGMDGSLSRAADLKPKPRKR